MERRYYKQLDPAHVREVDGFPRLEWNLIRNWIHQNVAASRADEALNEAVVCWLERLKSHLGKPYEIFASDSFYLLCPLEEERAHNLVWFAEDAWTKIRTHLDRVELAIDAQKEVILALADQDTYYTYISYFYTEGEYGASGGLHICEDYRHVVLPCSASWSLEAVITHELTHAVLSGLSLPAWVEEGLAQVLEELITGHRNLNLNAERKRMHNEYWKRHGLDAFWAGTVFHQTEDGQALGYELAQILVRNMASDFVDQFFEFIGSAKRNDAGEAAAQGYLGCSVSDCAAQFLGPGDWAPMFSEIAESENTDNSRIDG